MATRNSGGTEGTRGSASPPAVKDQGANPGRKGTGDLAAQAESRIERGKHDAAVTLNSVASRLRQSGTQLRDEQQDFAGEYVQRAAQQIERAANYLQTADLREIVDEVENFARRRPAVFIGGAFALGLLASRYLSNSRGTNRLGAEFDQSRYLDREVPPPVSMEPGRAPPSNPWREPL